MFERFTDRGRRVLVLAQEQARVLNHNFIGTEHILLGLIEEEEGVAARTLMSFGITAEEARARVAAAVSSKGSSSTGSPPFTTRAKKVLELSLREALGLGHNYIGTEHMLLGLVREGEGVGTQVLADLGAASEEVRVRVLTTLGAQLDWQPPGVGAPVPIGAPRCAACRASLEGQVGYRVLPVVPADAPAGEVPEPVGVAFVYCLRCGVVITHASVGDAAGA